MVHPFARRCVVLLSVFIVYVILIGATAVATEPSANLRRTSEVDTDGLSTTQARLVQVMAEKVDFESSGPKIKKRGYMNLVTELSRVELAAAAKAKATHAAVAKAAASAEATGQ
jgi:hypothetical protein